MSGSDAVAHYILGNNNSTFLRQGVVTAYRAGPPPMCDVEINCEGLFRDVGVATPRAPFVGETVWLIEQNGRFVVMGIQQNAVPPPSTGDTYHDPAIGGGIIEGPMIHHADIRTSTIRYSTFIGGTFSSPTLNNAILNSPVIVGGSMGGVPITDFVSGTGATITRPNLQQPVINSPSFDGGAQVVSSGAIRSANYIAGSTGWAIGGNGTAEFNNLLVRNSGIIGGVALGLLDIDGQVDGGSIASADFESGVSGWAIDGSGYAEFNSGYFRGSIAAGGSIDIGGADDTSFHVDIDGNLWLGSATYLTAPFRVSNRGAVQATSVLLKGSLRTNDVGARIDVGHSNVSQIAIYHNGPAITSGGAPVYPAYITSTYVEAPTGRGQLQIQGPKQNAWPAPSIHLIHQEDEPYGEILFDQVRHVLSTGTYRGQGGSPSNLTLGFIGRTDNTGIFSNGIGDLSVAANGVRVAGFGSYSWQSNTPGIEYIGTNGTGTPNRIGFKWSSPNLYGRIDNTVEAIVGTASDRRLKSNLQLLDGEQALAMLEPLSAYTYKPLPIADEPVRDVVRPGLIADEVEMHMPWAVPPVSEAGGYQSVDYLGMVPLLVAAVQCLSQQINELQQRITQ